MTHKLLVVDDDVLNAQTLKDIFTYKGYETYVALCGQEALEEIKKSRFSVILSDVRMDGMNGVELLRASKAIQKDIVFILMTAYTDMDLLMEGMKEGALVTLKKPLDIDMLLAQIAQILIKKEGLKQPGNFGVG